MRTEIVGQKLSGLPVVVNDQQLEEFEFESSTKKQLKGNIYLAKVTRVEPSLQAAFVDYGGQRHGFLAFSEIHPDYYQIPQADRRVLDEAERRDAQVPLGGRQGSAWDIAHAALFLASDEASFISGATLDVNGGLLMR